MNDDDLTTLIRTARPELPLTEATLDERKNDIFERIMSETTPVTQITNRSRRAPIQILFNVAAVLVILVLAGTGTLLLSRPGVAHAFTPPALPVQPLSATAKEVLMNAADQISHESTHAVSEFSYQAWQLESTDAGNGELNSVVQPAEITVSKNADGSVSRIARATETYPPGAGVVQPGDELWRLEYQPGEFDPVFPDPPTDPGAYGDYLREFASLPDAPTAGDYIHGIQALLTERTLEAREEMALLRFVASLPDLIVNGTLVDRLGRQGVSVSTTSRAPGEFIDSLIVSPTGSGILSSEMTYIGSDRTDISSPAVVLYYAWEK